jgi:hypothetical protein
MIEPTCGTCKHFRLRTNGKPHGKCTHGPYQFVDAETSAFPTVTAINPACTGLYEANAEAVEAAEALLAAQMKLSERRTAAEQPAAPATEVLSNAPAQPAPAEPKQPRVAIPQGGPALPVAPATGKPVEIRGAVKTNQTRTPL